MRVSYLGPTGSYNEEALRASSPGGELEPVPMPTIFAAISAVAEGEVELGLVPFENSIEGPVRATIDALAFDAPGVLIVGEYDLPIHHNLIARGPLQLSEIEAVLSHPQANAQCARFLREQLPGADVRSIASTSAAVRQVAESEEPWAALGSAAAARAFGCSVLVAGVEDAADNVTRFVWLSRDADAAPETGPGSWRTTLVFHELGEDHPGALVEALTEFAERGVNLTRIESRPLRQGLGRYLFVIDVEGSTADGPVAAAIEGLRGKAESVRVLGSYPIGGGPPSSSGGDAEGGAGAGGGAG